MTGPGAGPMPGLLVLWDIDRTLLYVSHLGAEAIGAAAGEVLGAPGPVELAEFVGRPEPASMLDTLRRHGMPEDRARAALPTALRLLRERLAQRADRFAEEGHVLPGVRTLLPALAADPRVLQSVLTGNLRDNALLKLRAFRLDGFLDTAVAAYGDDLGPDLERPALVDIARERARRAGHGEFPGTATVLVGDSLQDVAAAAGSGARLVAVATGVQSAAQLRAAGADVVFDDLGDVPSVLAAILAG